MNGMRPAKENFAAREHVNVGLQSKLYKRTNLYKGTKLHKDKFAQRVIFAQGYIFAGADNFA